jgi:hypothetical protein
MERGAMMTVLHRAGKSVRKILTVKVLVVLLFLIPLIILAVRFADLGWSIVKLLARGLLFFTVYVLVGSLFLQVVMLICRLFMKLFRKIWPKKPGTIRVDNPLLSRCLDDLSREGEKPE